MKKNKFSGRYLTTIRCLARSANRSAIDMLRLAKNSSHSGIRQAAWLELLSSSSPQNLLDVVRDFDSFDLETISLFAENTDKLASTIRAALLSKEYVLQNNAVRIAVDLKVYDIIPELLNILVERQKDLQKINVPLDDLLLKLTDLFRLEIDGSVQVRPYHNSILKTTAKMLQRSIVTYQRSDSPAVLKVYFYLVRYLTQEEDRISQVMRDPFHPAYVTAASLLQTENDPLIVQYIVDSLDVKNVPGFVLASLSCRVDITFWTYILKHLAAPLSDNMLNNLKRINRFDCSKSMRPLLSLLDEKKQLCLVNLLRTFNISPDDAFACFEQIIKHGKPAARYEAVSALSAYSRAEADKTIWKLTEDSDPVVQAAALSQLRFRKYSNSMTRLLKYADSPHRIVREAVRGALPEFRIIRFLDSFDKLSDEQRVASLRIISKLDSNMLQVLASELVGSDNAQKTKALLCVEIGNLVTKLEDQVCNVLFTSENPEVLRAKAALLLANGKREVSRNALLLAVHKDASSAVRDIAKESLESRMK
ncbi:MAG: HEAT repeat domain-containing protein [Thermoguttaceae bacterium]